MRLILALLSEKSKVSSMRLMSLISLLTACLIAGFGLYLKLDLLGLAALCGVFVSAAFGGKILQKNMEGNP